MNYKIHIPHCQYGFIEAESDNIEELIELNNKYNENKTELTENPTTKIIVDSFNENIKIDRIGFSYFYNGVKLLSPSSWIKQFYKPFESDFIAERTAKAYGVDKKELLKLWETNAKISADFGTVIHQALEMREKFKNIGSQIIEGRKKKDENKKNKDELVYDDPSVSKHPTLQKIIKDFDKVNKVKGEVHTEVLITDINTGRCGIIDRLIITGDKKCVIQDIKIQVGTEEKSSSDKPLKPYDNLDSNKLTKHRLQTSFYADILENTGWSTEIQSLVFDGKWKAHNFKKVEIK